MHGAPFAFISRARTPPARKDQEREGEREAAFRIGREKSAVECRDCVRATLTLIFFSSFFSPPRASPPSLSFLRAITAIYISARSVP